MNTAPSLCHANRENNMSRAGLSHHSKTVRTRVMNAELARLSLIQMQKELDYSKRVLRKTLRGTGEINRGIL